MQRIGRQIHPAPDDSGFELCRAVSAIAEGLQNRMEIRDEKDIRSSVSRQILLKTEALRVAAKVSLLEKLEFARAGREIIRSRFNTIDGVDNQIQLIQQWNAAP